MKIFAWLKSQTSAKHRANWLYHRGMARAKLHKHQAAIEDYTEVLQMEGVPSGLRAMALYNRALVYCALESQSNAVKDLKAVLGMPEAAEYVKKEARRKLLRMDRSSDRMTS
jgi:hypothetical protein